VFRTGQKRCWQSAVIVFHGEECPQFDKYWDLFEKNNSFQMNKKAKSLF